MKNFMLLMQLCLIFMTSCGPNQYSCKLDKKNIEDIGSTYRLTLNTNETLLNSSRKGEQYYKVVSIKNEAELQNVPIEDLVFMYKDELYCSLKCAEIDMNIKNKEVAKKRDKRKLIEIGDSLFLDSVKRGLR